MHQHNSGLLTQLQIWYLMSQAFKLIMIGQGFKGSLGAYVPQDKDFKFRACIYLVPTPLCLFQETWYWQGNTDASEVVLSGVRCKGTELSILQCQHHGPVHCPNGGGRFVAGVTCTQSK